MTYQHETIFECYFDALTKKDIIINSRDVARYEKTCKRADFTTLTAAKDILLNLRWVIDLNDNT